MGSHWLWGIAWRLGYTLFGPYEKLMHINDSQILILEYFGILRLVYECSNLGTVI
jgi:hypothetical protein